MKWPPEIARIAGIDARVHATSLLLLVSSLHRHRPVSAVV